MTYEIRYIKNEIRNTEVLVLVLAAYGHYGDK